MFGYTKKELSWILYDCGNSAYSIAITTALFPVYFGMIGGSSMNLGYYNSFASIIIALISPVLGTIADFRGMKKKLFTVCSIVAIFSTFMLSFAASISMFLIMTCFLVGNITFAATNIFYDSFLVDVTIDERMDKVSTSGFAYGYIASVIPFMVCLASVLFLGMGNNIGYQISFVITALWWLVLTIPMYKNVDQVYGVEPVANPLKESFSTIFKTFKDIREHKVVVIFLLSYFLYIDGVDTIIKMVVPYAQSVLDPKQFNTVILLAILVYVQVVAFPFAIIYGKLANKFGTKRMISVGIFTYMISVIFAYFMTSLVHVFVLSTLVASAQGGIQALSRSYFAKIIPKDHSNEFFGFYNIFGKFAAIVGPLIMSLITTITGQPRYSILGIIPLFVIGYLVMLKLPEEV
ncbi:MAG: MFS transporter [Peptoniphilaceae bacterium]|uniref:MFS transporter n=1 Tax=Parvimonas sp. TaxID=1944660 RepID=UPI0025CC6B97|nr:MFS transporter [Parvimonas sp.]MCI5997161.1 MFS transporter [Parvimonas sp.]MDD7764253.1 MFS transporter [Peptoniphilaceae bacterium]MDY3051516.1 MFS transporter [Parvimonas sp.]